MRRLYLTEKGRKDKEISRLQTVKKTYDVSTIRDLEAPCTCVKLKAIGIEIRAKIFRVDAC